MGTTSVLVIGIVIGATIIGIVYGVKKLVSWCSDISFDISFLKSSNKRTQEKFDDLNEICKYLSEHGTEVLKTFATVHDRLMDLETWKDDTLKGTPKGKANDD